MHDDRSLRPPILLQSANNYRNNDMIRYCVFKARYTLATKSTVADTVNSVGDTVDFVADFGNKKISKNLNSTACGGRLCRQCVLGFTCSKKLTGK